MGAAARLKKMKVLVAVVRSKDELGRPKKLEVVYDEEKVDVSKPENREFVTLMAEPGVFEPHLKGRA